MTISEVGIIDSLAFLVGILFEFPSGVISDKLGRKKTLILSQIIQFFGSFLILISSSKFEIAFGFIIFQLGVALYSGTIDSFGYEAALNEKFDYDKVLFNSSILSNFGYLFSVVVGGFFYTQSTNIPNYLMGLNYLVSLIFALLIYEGFELKKEDSNSNISNLQKFDLKYVLLLILIFSIVFSFDYGFLKLKILELFSNQDNNYFFIFTATLLSLGISKYITDNLKNYKFYLEVMVFSLIFILISFIFSDIMATSLFFVLSFLSVNLYQISMKYFNERLKDHERASVISMFNMFYKMPYVVLALIFGFSFENTSLGKVLGGLGIFLIIGYLLIKKIPNLRYNKG